LATIKVVKVSGVAASNVVVANIFIV